MDSLKQVAVLKAPSSWRKPSTSATLDSKVTTAGKALEKLVASLNSGTGILNPSAGITDAFGDSAEIYAQMALYDLYANSTQHQSQVSEGLKIVSQGWNDFEYTYINYPLAFGIASLRAYSAYSDREFLTLAEGAWSTGAKYTLLQSPVSQNITVKSFGLQGNCNGSTMTGGSFWTTNFNDPYLNVISSGSMFLLSSLLAEATSNQTYIDAATLSKKFIQDHLFDQSTGIVLDGIQADSCVIPPSGSDKLPYNTGLLLEGLAVLTSITGDSSLRDLLHQTIAASLVSPAWQGMDGIIASPLDGRGDAILFRALSQVYIRNRDDSELGDFITAYLSVQYNAILDLATTGDNVYSGAWTGPAAITFSVVNQTNAAGALVSMIPINDLAITGNPGPTPSTSELAPLSSVSGTSTTSILQSNPSSSSIGTSSASPQPPPTTSHELTSIPLGPVVGTLVSVLALLCVIIVLIIRRRNRIRAARPIPLSLDSFTRHSGAHVLTARKMREGQAGLIEQSHPPSLPPSYSTRDLAVEQLHANPPRVRIVRPSLTQQDIISKFRLWRLSRRQG